MWVRVRVLCVFISFDLTAASYKWCFNKIQQPQFIMINGELLKHFQWLVANLLAIVYLPKIKNIFKDSFFCPCLLWLSIILLAFLSEMLLPLNPSLHASIHDQKHINMSIIHTRIIWLDCKNNNKNIIRSTSSSSRNSA